MSNDDLVRLGHYVTSRRVALGYKKRVHFANALGITPRTLADIENGDRRSSAGTYALIENTLLWKPGSVWAIRQGREPTVLDQPEESDGFRSLTTEELLDLQAEIQSELQSRYRDLRGTPERGRRKSDKPRRSIGDTAEPTLQQRASQHVDEDSTGGLGAVGRG